MSSALLSEEERVTKRRRGGGNGVPPIPSLLGVGTQIFFTWSSRIGTVHPHKSWNLTTPLVLCCCFPLFSTFPAVLPFSELVSNCLNMKLSAVLTGCQWTPVNLHQAALANSATVSGEHFLQIWARVHDWSSKQCYKFTPIASGYLETRLFRL